MRSFAKKEKPKEIVSLNEVGISLVKRLGELQKKISNFTDERIGEWDVDDVDLEKAELYERIVVLEEQQIKILARYEQMRQTLSAVSEQVFGLKQKLRYHKQEAIINMAKTLKDENFPIPTESDQLREVVVALKVENKVLSARAPQLAPAHPAAAGGGGGPAGGGGGGARATGGPQMGAIPNAPPGVKSGQNLQIEGDTIIAGTRAQLLGCLLSKANPDANFTVDFLSVYTQFCTSSVLLQNVIQRYKSSTEKSQQLRVFNIVKEWIRISFLEFRDDPSLKESLKEFAPTMAEVVTEKQTTMLLALLDKKINSVESEPKTYLIPKSREWNLLKLDSNDIARQMTLHDSKLYRLIDPRVAISSPEDLLIFKRVKKVETWVAREVSKSKAKKSVLIKKFIEIIEHCRRLRNFHSTFVLLDAVCATSEDNKKLIMKGVKKLSDLASTVDSSRATYKKILKEGKLPCIPAFKFELEVFHKCRDIPSEVAGPDEQMLINFEKYRASASVLQEIQFFQKAPYDKSVQLNSTMMGYVQALPA
mmetsp:Transcript_27909/g.38775  ORF Transcript_27909/g.38775 Transcript_27909/m.38775 type:complete len:535 (-) Transcript_27909:73-1677(-)